MQAEHITRSQAFSEPKPEENCWSKTFTLLNRKALLQRARKKGLSSRASSTADALNCKNLSIVGISLSEQNFEGKELLRGIFSWKVGFKVFFT